MRWLIAALAGPSFVAAWVAGVVDVVRRADLALRRRLAWVVGIVLAPAYLGLLYAAIRPVRVDRVVVGGAPPTVQPRRPPGPRFVQQVAQLASRGLFRSVEMVRPASVASSGPQLWLASHFGAFSDVVVLLHALERHPRFLAGDFLFRVPLFRSLLRMARAIPVVRTKDRQEAAAGQPVDTFAASWDALAQQDAVAIFPEGVANPGAAIAPLRTGAARIALGAHARGVRGLQVVPVGIHYQDRAAFRSRVYVDVGEPLDLDTWVSEREPDAVGETDRDLVRALTDDLEHRLRFVAPEFTDLEEASSLHVAARIALHDRTGAPPSWAPEADLADELGRRSADDRVVLCRAVRTYRAALDATGVRDEELVARPRRSRRRLLLTAVVGAALLPFAAAGAIVHGPMVALVAGLRRLPWSAPTKASVLPAVALLGTLASWIAWAMILTVEESGAARAGAVAALLLVFPLWGVAFLLVVERVTLAVRAVRSAPRRWRARSAQDALAELRRSRRRIVRLVEEGGPQGR